MDGLSGCGSDADRYSIGNRTREIQRSASTQKIHQLRKSFEQLIGGIAKAEDVDEDNGAQIDNPFSSETLQRDISLSVYNTPKKMVEVKERPVITQDYLLRGMKGYKTPTVTVEGEAPPEGVTTQKTVREPLLPEIQTEIGEMITKDGTDQFR